METSLSIPTDATSTETAAIAAAIGAYVRDRRAAVAATAAIEAGESGNTWTGRRWEFAGRLESHGGPGRRVPETVPTDAWAAAGRLEHME